MKLKAYWIWKKQRDYNRYNQTIIAWKAFKLDSIRQATIDITADSFYRLYINNRWVNDGPCRSWLEHYQYDEFDITAYLKEGINQIKIIARYFGVGTMHQIPKQAGLLVQIEILGEKHCNTIITDDSWHVTEAGCWISSTPRVFITMEPMEFYDARLDEKLKFSKAAILYKADKGPWKNLNPRDCPLLTRIPFFFKCFKQVNIVKKDWLEFTVPVARLLYPGVIEANLNLNLASAIASVIMVKKKKTIHIETKGYRVKIDGKEGRNGTFELAKGKHFILGMIENYFDHQKEAGVRFLETQGFRLENPINAGHENPWCFIHFKELLYQGNDMIFPCFTVLPFYGDAERDAISSKTEQLLKKISNEVKDIDSFNNLLKRHIKLLCSREMFVTDSHWQFMSREVIDDGVDFIDNPAGLMYNNDEYTTVNPCHKGDIEFMYDLGEQNCGYYDIELIADEGVIVDVFGVEYITSDGEIQHTIKNRNGMRYICKHGLNRFVSLKRRSGRYIFITIRNQQKPVKIRKFQLIESTYPVEYQDSFSCSDPLLEKIWDISSRTLKLCMEDTFTDCPLYEQVLWVGDFRNEALFAYTAFGACDLAKRCITLTGQSLERFSITGCQVPSSWECLLPAWSFLWGISVWEYYFYSGDINFLKKSWKWVVKNLKGAQRLSDKRGLFSGPFWNMFDWAGIDDRHLTVLHNSMFLVGAINAAIECGKVLEDKKTIKWLKQFRKELINAINNLWDKNKKAYPDSIYEDGAISQSSSQHTSFLSIIYGIIDKENIKHVTRNILNPPLNMVKVGSPFAMMYLYEALEKLNLPEKIIESIYKNYRPMIDKGATTVWETFSTGTLSYGKFPTRSHCHGWSSVSIYFLNRIILGIKQTAPAGGRFDISPYIWNLKSASGASATVNSPVKVEWERKNQTLVIKASAPQGVKLRFIKNPSHQGLVVFFNSRKVSRKL